MIIYTTKNIMKNPFKSIFSKLFTKGGNAIEYKQSAFSKSNMNNV
jgi:hypothetical protein